jgi:hypothetical protein
VVEIGRPDDAKVGLLLEEREGLNPPKGDAFLP